jgi:type IV secretion system protein VirB10
MSPEVQQKTTPPPGNIPRGRQAYVMIAVAVVIVLAVVFSGPGSPPQKAAVVVPPLVNTPSKAEIDRYTQNLKMEEERLRRAQEEAARSQTAMNQAAAGINSATQGGIPGQAVVVGPNGQPYYPAPGYQPAPLPEKSAIEQEKDKREYASLFASNVALSYRKAPEAGDTNPERELKEPAPVPPAPSAKAPPRTGHTLFEGTLLEADLTNRLDGSFSGPVNCQITANVYSRDHQHLLIPQGSRVLGEARRVDQQDQQRMAVVFHRLIMPDGYSVNLDQIPGLDQAGATGVRDKVNHHYLSLFGTSIALGVLSGFSLYGTGGVYTGSGTDAYRQGVSSELGRDATRILDRQLNRLPTITVREGTRIKVYLSQDITLPAYDAHPDGL